MQKVIKSQHHCQEGWYLSTIYRVETRQEWDRRQMSIKGGVCIGWLYKFDPPTPKQCIKPGKVSKARVLCSWYPSFCIGLPRHTSNTATESIWNWIRSTAGEGVKNGLSPVKINMWNRYVKLTIHHSSMPSLTFCPCTWRGQYFLHWYWQELDLPIG